MVTNEKLLAGLGSTGISCGVPCGDARTVFVLRCQYEMLMSLLTGIVIVSAAAGED
jgi:hypothetical protein